MHSVPGPAQIQAGLSGKLVVATIVPTCAVAVGMHYNADFRSRMDKFIPGASDVLSKITNSDYNASGGDGSPRNLKSNLPPGYETLPKLLHRIEEEKVGRDSEHDGQGSSGSNAPESPGQQALRRAGDGTMDLAQDSSGPVPLSSTAIGALDVESRIAKVFGRRVFDTQLQSDDFDVSVYHRPRQRQLQPQAEYASKV
jgi:hypothetical protein